MFLNESEPALNCSLVATKLGVAKNFSSRCCFRAGVMYGSGVYCTVVVGGLTKFVELGGLRMLGRLILWLDVAGTGPGDIEAA